MQHKMSKKSIVATKCADDTFPASEGGELVVSLTAVDVVVTVRGSPLPPTGVTVGKALDSGDLTAPGLFVYVRTYWISKNALSYFGLPGPTTLSSY